jgi:hypothetical protein
MPSLAEEVNSIATVVPVTVAGGARSVRVCDLGTEPTALVAVKVKIHWSFEVAEETFGLYVPLQATVAGLLPVQNVGLDLSEQLDACSDE